MSSHKFIGQIEKFKLAGTAATVVTEEEEMWPFLQYFSLDAILLTVCLIAWIVFKFVSSGSKKNTHNALKSGDASSRIAEEAPPERSNQDDSASLLNEILSCSDRSRGRVLDLYQKSRGRIDWANMEPEKAYQAFFNFCLAAARQGHTTVLESLLQDMKRLGIKRDADLYTNLLRMVTSKKMFGTALCLWRKMRNEQIEVDDRSTWSCLLFAAVQEKEYQAALSFFRELKKCGPPVAADYGNVCRTLVTLGEVVQAVKLIDEMHAEGIEPYRVTYQTVFAACCQHGQHLDLAEQLLVRMKEMDGVCDSVIYNMLIKGYVQQDRLEDAMARFADMEKGGVSPSSVTFGILLDASIDAGNMDKAVTVFQQMTKMGLKMNAVLFTTMIKGFAKVGRTKDAIQLYHDMLALGVEPDRVTYATLIKVLSDSKELEGALMLFEEMVKKGCTPDEVTFNNLLTGCVACANMLLGETLLKDMASYGIKPSVATISIMLKLYSRCQGLPKALMLLQSMDVELGIPQEQRLYVQLVNTCLSVRRGKLAMDTLKAMKAHFGSLPSENEIAKFLRLCANFRLLEEAVQIAALALEAGCAVTAEHLEPVCEAAAKFQNNAAFQATLELARRHKIRLQAVKLP